MNTMDELQLIELAKAKDADAFCRLYELYQRRLYRYAYYRLGSAQDAEDAVSETVLAAWRGLDRLREPKAFPAWIFRILSARCSRLISAQIERRERNPQGTASSAGSDEPADPATVDPDQALILENALSQLSSEAKDIVLLSVVGGLSSQEISDLTGAPAGTVRSTLSRSLKKLRGYLS